MAKQVYLLLFEAKLPLHILFLHALLNDNLIDNDLDKFYGMSQIIFFYN